MNITLKNGTIKEFDIGTTAADITKAIGMGLYKSACAVKLNGKLVDLRTELHEDCELEVLTFEHDEGKKVFRHTASHLLAAAATRLFPNAKFAIGPAIDNGFYYDFQVEKPFSAQDLQAIENEMKIIAKEVSEITRFEKSPQDAKKLMADQPFKLELIDEHANKGENISFYQLGDFLDLCAGPHLMSCEAIKAVKLTQATGAYWRGDSTKQSLCRVYGTAFPKASELEAYLAQVEEAKKRDHNKIGRELEFFTTVDTIGQGLPILLPKGARVIQLLQRFVEDTEQKRGYLLTKTPLMAKRELYKISGHWDHYREGMFIMGDADDEAKECFALRPMTCPFQYQVFLNKKRSYRELPMRLGETSTLFRNEDSGEMHGLIRVRQFTISEGHLIVRPDQLEEEFEGCLSLAKYMLETLGLADDCTYRFSQWDENRNDKYEGSPAQWNAAQAAMGKILDNIGVKYTVAIDEAAFYGPKLDIQIRNVHGKEDTLITIQIDMLLAEKFGMSYIDTDGGEKLPYIIHRTSIGCYERTLALLLEKYAGALPVWLSPEQVRVIPIADAHQAYANELVKQLDDLGVRATADTRNEKMGYKIREAQLEKVPYMLVVGNEEMENNTVAVRARKEEKGGVKPFNDFKSQIVAEIASKEI